MFWLETEMLVIMSLEIVSGKPNLRMILRLNEVFETLTLNSQRMILEKFDFLVLRV